jgi:hypothetical protein
VFILEQLHAITSVAPETPHEKWFQEKFGKLLWFTQPVRKEAIKIFYFILGSRNGDCSVLEI